MVTRACGLFRLVTWRAAQLREAPGSLGGTGVADGATCGCCVARCRWEPVCSSLPPGARWRRRRCLVSVVTHSAQERGAPAETSLRVAQAGAELRPVPVARPALGAV